MRLRRGPRHREQRREREARGCASAGGSVERPRRALLRGCRHDPRQPRHRRPPSSATSARASTGAHRASCLRGAGLAADGGVAPPRVVRGVRPRPPLAPHARPVRDPRLGGHAPADAGRPGRAAVRALARAVADGRGARRGLARRGDRRMAGARLQPSGACAPPRGGARRGARLARRPDRAAGRRAVHGGRAPELRLRRGRPAARRQRRAGRAAHGAHVHRRCRAGADGSRCNRVPGADPAVRASVLSRSACPSRGTRDEPARKQSRFEGSFRQRRAAALRLVAERAPARRPSSTPRPSASLERDGLVVVERGVVRLPA